MAIFSLVHNYKQLFVYSAHAVVRVTRLTAQQIQDAIRLDDEDDVTVEELPTEEDVPIDSPSDSDSDSAIVIDELDTGTDYNDSEDGEEEANDTNEVTVVPENVSSRQFIGRDGTVWDESPPDRFRSRSNSYHTFNRVNLIPGQHIDTPVDAFDCFFTSYVVHLLVKYTNMHALNMNPSWKPTDEIEMRAFIGLLICAGIDHASRRNYIEFFDKLRGYAIFRATMGLKRFQSMLSYIRFDDKNTRSYRRAKDKLAPIRDFFDTINSNLKRMYSPNDCLTIDEQLVPFRGRCPFKQYIPSKPDRYGMKIFWICDSNNSYPLNGIPYLGRNRDGARAVGLAHQIVRELCVPFERTNRNITMDNYFTSYELAQELLSHGLTCVGTVRKNRKFLPAEFQANRRRPVGSTLFGFRAKHTLVSHVPKQNKSVLLLSPLHHTPVICDSGKSEVNEYYNATKGGVDVMDRMCHAYSCQRGTNRWPFAFFCNLINVCGIASFVIYNNKHNIDDIQASRTRRKFLIDLSDMLVYDQVMRRSTHGTILPHRLALHDVREHLGSPSVTAPTAQTNERGACYMCPKTINRKTKTCCSNCNRNVCGEHHIKTILCVICEKQIRNLNSSSDSN